VTSPAQRRQQPDDGHRAFEELAVGHALSALEPEEQERFQAHLVGCARCERDVAEHQAVLGQLAHAAPSVEPPPSLLEGIRAAVRAEAGDSATTTTTAARVPDQLAERRARRAVQVKRGHLLTSAAAWWPCWRAWAAGTPRCSATTPRPGPVRERGRRGPALGSPEARTVRLTTPVGDVAAVAVVDGEQRSLVLDGLEPNQDDTGLRAVGAEPVRRRAPVGTFDVHDADLDVLHGMRLEQGVGDV
jgi:hypothetical protein